jgi:hypothetical protein
MAMNFGTCATGQPKRGLPRTAGSLAGSALRMRARHRAELLGADVGHYAARVAQLAFAVDQAWLLAAGVAIANQFPLLSSCRWSQ